MRHCFLSMILLLQLSLMAQPGRKLMHPGPGNRLIADSTFVVLQKVRDSMGKVELARRDSIENAVQINILVQQQKDAQGRRKRAAFIRIAIGIGLLIVLVIGLRRKKKVNPN